MLCRHCASWLQVTKILTPAIYGSDIKLWLNVYLTIISHDIYIGFQDGDLYRGYIETRKKSCIMIIFQTSRDGIVHSFRMPSQSTELFER